MSKTYLKSDHFHGGGSVTAYDILRHNGVDIGKRDYLSHVGQFIHERG
jgi:hypothetical protein